MIDQKKITEWKSAWEEIAVWSGHAQQGDAGAGRAASARLAGLASEAFPALLAERDELLALLREIQWADNSGDEYTAECPCCGGTSPVSAANHDYDPNDRDISHRPDCRLAAFLR